MIAWMPRLAWPLLRALDPERAHGLTLLALEAGLHPRARASGDPRLAQEIWGLGFANPVGVAAGFDKDARVPDALMAMGLGFAEVGTLTPRAQLGNPRPRIFRLAPERAVINRLGFNNRGHAAALARLERRPKQGIVGVNIGANATSTDRVADYVAGLEAFSDVADYIAVNISSPNTVGLRDLQAPEALDALLTRLMEARDRISALGRRQPPLAIKLAPDIHDDDLPLIIERLMAHRVDGIIVSNTTIARDGVAENSLAAEAGGLSGAPLFARSTRMLAMVHGLTGGKVPLVGVGGIDTGARAVEKIAAGASLIQLYTGLVYEGPALIGRIKRALSEALQARRLSSITELIGRDADAWARRP